MIEYRVTRSEYLSLYKLRNELANIELMMQSAPVHIYTDEQLNKIQDRICEVEELMNTAYGKWALVDWLTLKRIREIQDEQQLIKNCSCFTDVISVLLQNR